MTVETDLNRMKHNLKSQCSIQAEFISVNNKSAINQDIFLRNYHCSH